MGEAMLGVFLCVWLFFVGFVMGYGICSNGYHKDLVDRGHATYCPDNGAWAYKGECK